MSDARACLVAFKCLLRNLPLLVRPHPKTPLRILAVMALDFLHMLRRTRPMPRRRPLELAMFLDFQACTNAEWDRKAFCAREYETMRRRLESAGLARYIEAYLTRLQKLESQRPSIAGAHRRFDDVRSYREAVARLSLAAAAALALDAPSVEEEILAIDRDGDLQALFRIALQCQVVDDVLDYREDLSAGLPSFLTATVSLPQAISRTARVARCYGNAGKTVLLPLRVALALVTAMTTFTVRVARARQLLGPQGRLNFTSPAGLNSSGVPQTPPRL